MVYYCPRCGSRDIYEYDEIFYRKRCKDKNDLPLTFDKEMFDTIEENKIFW